MKNQTIQTRETPTFWKWYFGWNPRIFLTAPIFLIFVYLGLWFVLAEIKDVLFFFQHTEVTWMAILLIMCFGVFLFWFIIAPIVICFWSIDWLYKINIEKNSPWKKFLYSIGIILLVTVGTSLIRAFTAWVSLSLYTLTGGSIK